MMMCKIVCMRGGMIHLARFSLKSPSFFLTAEIASGLIKSLRMTHLTGGMSAQNPPETPS